MSIILKTLKASNGKIVADDNKEVDDVYTDLINTTSTSTGNGLTIIEDDGAYFIPNDLKDRQAIIDTITILSNSVSSLADVISSVNNAISSMAPDPTAPAKITQIKQDITELNSNLQQIKEELI